jgi:hypothetical protein
MFNELPYLSNNDDKCCPRQLRGRMQLRRGIGADFLVNKGKG